MFKGFLYHFIPEHGRVCPTHQALSHNCVSSTGSAVVWHDPAAELVKYVLKPQLTLILGWLEIRRAKMAERNGSLFLAGFAVTVWRALLPPIHLFVYTFPFPHSLPLFLISFPVYPCVILSLASSNLPVLPQFLLFLLGLLPSGAVDSPTASTSQHSPHTLTPVQPGTVVCVLTLSCSNLPTTYPTPSPTLHPFV